MSDVKKRVRTKKLTRGEVARLLGISKGTVRYREGKSLHPTIGPRGVRLFAMSEVTRCAIAERAKSEKRDAAVIAELRQLRADLDALGVAVDAIAASRTVEGDAA